MKPVTIRQSANSCPGNNCIMNLTFFSSLNAVCISSSLLSSPAVITCVRFLFSDRFSLKLPPASDPGREEDGDETDPEGEGLALL